MAGCPGRLGAVSTEDSSAGYNQVEEPSPWGLERGAGCRPLSHLTHTQSRSHLWHTEPFSPAHPERSQPHFPGENCGSGPAWGPPQLLRKPRPLADLSWSMGQAVASWRPVFGVVLRRKESEAELHHTGSEDIWSGGVLGCSSVGDPPLPSPSQPLESRPLGSRCLLP